MTSYSTFCSLPFRKLKVHPNGDVNMCCYQKGILGNLFEQNVSDIWHGFLAKEIRQSTLDSNLHTVCKGWGACPFLNIPLEPKCFSADKEFPSSIEFDLPNTHCNIGGLSPTPESACFMCPRSSPLFRPEPDHSLEIAGHLKCLMPRLSELRVQGTAEPFWKGRIFEILERLEFERYQDTCTFSTYTNGTIFGKHERRQFSALCPRAAIFFSVDASTPETYIKIRRLNVFSRVVDNIGNFIAERGKTQRVDIANNLNLLNIDEAVRMVELASDLGVDGVQFNPTHDGGEAREDFRHLRVGPENYERFDEAERNIRVRAQELGIKVFFVRPLGLDFAEHGSWSRPEKPVLLRAGK